MVSTRPPGLREQELPAQAVLDTPAFAGGAKVSRAEIETTAARPLRQSAAPERRRSLSWGRSAQGRNRLACSAKMKALLSTDGPDGIRIQIYQRAE